MYDNLRAYCRSEGLDEYSLRTELKIGRRANDTAAVTAEAGSAAERYIRPLKAGYDWPKTPEKVID